ncbi:TfoX/Sxy family protein [uncultured Amnibacterium sp.]|uniref:TfoX/Sxy family protein n=1 Tax=uncultured Amnibacterium sp. TaxID=1631851 RepID=UPI0035C9754F
MSTSKAVADAIVLQLQQVADVRSRAMMGGRLIYADEVLVGQINEDELFVKASAFVDEYAPELERRPPYDGAKPAAVVPTGRLDDQGWLRGLLAGSVEALRGKR